MTQSEPKYIMCKRNLIVWDCCYKDGDFYRWYRIVYDDDAGYLTIRKDEPDNKDVIFDGDFVMPPTEEQIKDIIDRTEYPDEYED